MRTMTSRERVLATIRRQPVDHLPLCFEGLCHGITRLAYDLHPSARERADFYLSLGVDAGVGHSPPAMLEERCQVRAWREPAAGEDYPLLVKEYLTPGGGVLRQKVRWTPDYDDGPYGKVARPGEVRLFSDHNVPPSRSVEYLVSGAEQLPALQALLRPLDGPAREAYLRDAAAVRAFCEQRSVLMTGYLSGIGDPMIWMSGVEPLLMLALDQPGVLAEYVRIVADWDLKTLELMIDAGCQYVVRRGWYESADFWSPALFRQFLMEPLRREIALAHQRGVVYAYCMNSGIMPLVEALAELDLDVLCNVDPMAAGTDLPAVKQRLGNKMILCGGVNNNHVLEQGTPEEVRAAVNWAIDTLGPGGLMLAPGDSILATSETARRNFQTMIDAWQTRR